MFIPILTVLLLAANKPIGKPEVPAVTAPAAVARKISLLEIPIALSSEIFFMIVG
jgi:hypothetical protein